MVDAFEMRYGTVGFGKTVDLNEFAAEPFHALDEDVVADWRGAVDEGPQAGEVGFFDAGCDEQKLDQCGDHEGIGDSMPRNGLQYRRRVDVAHHDIRRAAVVADHCPPGPGDVECRHYRQVHPVGGEFEVVSHLRDDTENALVVQQHTLG